MRWERIASEVVYRGRIVDLHVDTVRVTGAARSEERRYDVVRHPGAAAIVPLFDDGSVGLVRQYRHATGEQLLEIPAGTLESGEPHRACAERELAEELGLAAGRWTELATFYSAPGFTDEVLCVYLAESLVPGTGVPDEDEHLEPVRVPLSEAIEMITDGRIRDAKTIIGLMMARDRRAPATADRAGA